MRYENPVPAVEPGHSGFDSTEPVLEELRREDQPGIVLLWREWFSPLVRFLDVRLGKRHDPLVDPEEIAADTILWFARSTGSVGAMSRAHLGRTLRCAGALRLLERLRRSRRLKRDERRSRAGDDSHLERIPDVRRSGEKAVDFKDELLRLIALLSSEKLRSIARMQWLDERSTWEISESLGISRRSVELKLKSIHERWRRHLQCPPPPGGGGQLQCTGYCGLSARYS